MAEPIEVVPATDERGARNEISIVDLCAATPNDLAGFAAGLTTRHYAHMNTVTFLTDLTEDGVFALDVRAASAGGATLCVQVDERPYSTSWGAGPTHQVGRLFAVPVPPGRTDVTVSALSGTVVVDRYILFPTIAEAEGVEMTELDPLVFEQRKADGYRGIWYYNQKLDNEYVYKYSGGLGTYCAKHIPFAVYVAEADKTFFVYGGRADDANRLLIMASYYDHATGMVPRPTVLCDKQTDDAHDNPVIAVDDDGHVWVFASAHGTSRPAYIFRSHEPHSVDSFELVSLTNFSYPQVHYIPGKGFAVPHTRYKGGRVLHWMSSPDGREWSEPIECAKIAQGHYEISNRHGDRVGCAFNYHPPEIGLNYRTNLYYMETDDLGETWRNISGDSVELPLTEVGNAALVHDYEAEALLVYLKDINFDAEGRPVVLYVTSKGFESGPQNDPRTWTTARWTGAEWDIKPAMTSDNNYDTGCLHIEDDGTWRLIGPTETGPQPYNPGGEIAMWVSLDQGETWEMLRQLTEGSEFNHTYVRRPVNAHPDFYGFWADGHGRQPSESRLYFCDKSGEKVRRLPTKMDGDFANPERVP